MAGPESSRPSSAAGIVFLALVLVGIAVFYFGVYDTAAGRCNRGDLSACVVAVAQQPQPLPAPTSTPAPQTPAPPPTSAPVRSYARFLEDVAAGRVAYASWCRATGRMYVHGGLVAGSDYFVVNVDDLAQLTADVESALRQGGVVGQHGVNEECDYDAYYVP